MTTNTVKPTPSWRDALPIHRACAMFDPLPPDELHTLSEDIKKNGLRIAVTVWKKQKHFPPELLDGRNRLDGIEAAGLTIWVENRGTESDPAIRLSMRQSSKDMWWPIEVIETRGDQGIDPYAYVLSANIHRRHLSVEQKRELIGKLIKAQPEKSDRQIAKRVKASHHTVGDVRAKMESRGQVAHVETRTDSKGLQQPAKKARPVRVPKTTKLSRETPKRDDIGPASSSEIARKDAELEELRDAKRRLEIENVGLRSEIEEAKAGRKPKPTRKGEKRCSFCLKNQYEASTLITSCDGVVAICNECVDTCVDMLTARKAAKATPPSEPEALAPNDPGPMPACLRRTAP
jgi:ClpX C4-type zinc finger